MHIDSALLGTSGISSEYTGCKGLCPKTSISALVLKRVLEYWCVYLWVYPCCTSRGLISMLCEALWHDYKRVEQKHFLFWGLHCHLKGELTSWVLCWDLQPKFLWGWHNPNHFYWVWNMPSLLDIVSSLEVDLPNDSYSEWAAFLESHRWQHKGLEITKLSLIQNSATSETKPCLFERVSRVTLECRLKIAGIHFCLECLSVCHQCFTLRIAVSLGKAHRFCIASWQWLCDEAIFKHN